MRDPVVAYVGVGANLGDPQAAVLQALHDLARLPGTDLRAASALYLTAPVGATGPDYINAVAAIDTRLCAPDLLSVLQQLEQVAGRERPWPNAPRTLDLDLLLYGESQIDSPWLTVPHPRWTQRAFVLLPLAQIAPDRVSPALRAAVASQAITRL